MVTVKNKQVIIKEIVIPDSYVRIWLTSEEDFFNTILPEEGEEDGGNYFKVGNTYIALGDGVVFYYDL